MLLALTIISTGAGVISALTAAIALFQQRRQPPPQTVVIDVMIIEAPTIETLTARPSESGPDLGFPS